MTQKTETIAAIATPPGRGGVGIVRISGPKALTIATQLTDKYFKPRVAELCDFKTKDEILDSGLVLYFKAPHSFTGEDVIELQGHGGPVIMDMLLNTVLKNGARMARPGEFSERAFLNDKIDLAQAEAIADLIDAQTEQAAKSATRSLQGEFSKKINVLLEKLIHLRMYVEAAIDFPEEEIDFLSDGKVSGDLTDIQKELNTVLASAKQGALLKEGMTVVIAGKPNAGKSSLLNCLSGRDSAIVTEIEGTTRDVLKEHIQLDGLPLHIVDTAGLRESDDVVEKEGVRRAYQAINDADVILLVTDINHNEDLEKNYPELFKSFKKIIIAYNKMDLSENKIAQRVPGINVSAKTGEGLDALKQALKESVQFHDIEQSQFIARRRHIDALVKAKQAVDTGAAQLTNHQAGELLAEDLRIAQQHLSEITGEFTTDDLLGKIFSSFCIGK